MADGGTQEGSATPAYQIHPVTPAMLPTSTLPDSLFFWIGSQHPPLTEVTGSALVSPPRTTCLFSFVLLDGTSNEWVIPQLRNLHWLPTALRAKARCCSSRAHLALQPLPIPHTPILFHTPFPTLCAFGQAVLAPKCPSPLCRGIGPPR